MRRFATVFLASALAAGCRAGFPSLADAPVAAQPRLEAARAAASERQASLRRAMPAAEAPPPDRQAPTRPARLLAALAVNDVAPTDGVIDRAIAIARETERRLLVVGVGETGRNPAAALAREFESRGVTPMLQQITAFGDTPHRVELYLAP